MEEDSLSQVTWNLRPRKLIPNPPNGNLGACKVNQATIQDNIAPGLPMHIGSFDVLKASPQKKKKRPSFSSTLLVHESDVDKPCSSSSQAVRPSTLGNANKAIYSSLDCAKLHPREDKQVKFLFISFTRRDFVKSLILPYKKLEMLSRCLIKQLIR